VINLTATLQERAEKLDALRALTDAAEVRGSLGEDKAKLDALADEIRELDTAIAEYEAARSNGGPSLGRGTNGDALTRDASFAEWYEQRNGSGLNFDGLTGDARDFNLGRVLGGLVRPDVRRDMTDAEARALAEGVDAQGGFMIPEFLASKVIDRVRNKAQVLRAGALTVPMQSDTLNLARLAGGNAAQWKAENDVVTDSDQTYERVTLKTHTVVCQQKLSVELFEDLSPEGSKTIENEIISALALALDYAALRGDPGATAEQPRGIRNQAGVNLIDLGANGATPTDFDFLIDAIAAIRDENGEASAAIMASRTLTTLDKLKDSTGQPLRQPEVVANLTKLTSNQIPTNLAHGTSNDTSEVYVGGFENVLIGVRPSLSFRFRVLNERYMDRLQVAFIAWLRADVALAHPEHLSVVTGVKP